MIKLLTHATLFGGSKSPAYMDILKEPSELTDWPAVEKALTELKFCKDTLGKLNLSINAEKNLIENQYADEKNKLGEQIAKLTENITEYLSEHPDEVTEKKQFLDNVEIEEIHKFKIKFKKGNKNEDSN